MASDSRLTAREVSVRGDVQGVGFRFQCVSEAARLGVAGWVSNDPDGSVSGHFEGAADAVDALVAWCRVGPSHARVDFVDAQPADVTGTRRFSVR
jgi:acylphosphatase